MMKHDLSAPVECVHTIKMVLYMIMNQHYRSAIFSTAFPQGTEACTILQRALEMQQFAIQLDQIPANPLHLPCAHYSRHCCCFCCCCSVHCSYLHLHVASEALSCRLLLLYQAESQYGHALSLSITLALRCSACCAHFTEGGTGSATMSSAPLMWAGCYGKLSRPCPRTANLIWTYQDVQSYCSSPTAAESYTAKALVLACLQVSIV